MRFSTGNVPCISGTEIDDNNRTPHTTSSPGARPANYPKSGAACVCLYLHSRSGRRCDARSLSAPDEVFRIAAACTEEFLRRGTRSFRAHVERKFSAFLVKLSAQSSSFSRLRVRVCVYTGLCIYMSCRCEKYDVLCALDTSCTG